MRDYDRQGKNKITYQDFHEIGKNNIKNMMLEKIIDEIF